MIDHKEVVGIVTVIWPAGKIFGLMKAIRRFLHRCVGLMIPGNPGAVIFCKHNYPLVTRDHFPQSRPWWTYRSAINKVNESALLKAFSNIFRLNSFVLNYEHEHFIAIHDQKFAHLP